MALPELLTGFINNLISLWHYVNSVTISCQFIIKFGLAERGWAGTYTGLGCCIRISWPGRELDLRETKLSLCSARTQGLGS